MKKIIFLIALLAVSFSSNAQSKIGTIDAEFILAQMPGITAVNEGLETYNTELQKSLDSTITKYEGLVKIYQENLATLSEDEKVSQENEIISLENDIKSFRQKASLMMQMKRNELTQPLYDQINEAMLAVVAEEDFTQVFHASSNDLAFSAEGFDITMKVLNKLGIKVEETAQATDSQ